MSFGAEMKDFVEGFKTGEGIKEGRDRHQAALDAHEKNRMPTEAEMNKPNSLGGGSGGGAIPESPGDTYDYSDINIESDPAAAKMLGFIRHNEAGSNPYNKLVGGKTGDLTNMTVGDVLKYQQGMKAQGHESTALGAYQFVHDTLASAVDKTNMPLDAKFDQATQDKLGYYLLQKRGWHDYKNGKIDKDTLMDNIAHEWASLPLGNGKSAYAGVGSNAATTSRQQFASALDFDQPVEQKSAAAAAPAAAPAAAAAQEKPAPAAASKSAEKPANVGWNQPEPQPQPQLSTTIAPPANQMAMLDPALEEEQPTMWGADGGVIPEPQYFAAGGSTNPSATGGVDNYSSGRGYTQAIAPSSASSIRPSRSVGYMPAGQTAVQPMKMVNGMTPTQLAYKQATDKLAADRAAKMAATPAAAAAPAAQGFADKARAFNAKQQAMYSQMYNNPYGNRGGMNMQYMDPATGNISSQFMQGSGNYYSHRAEGGMVYHDFAEGGVIPEGGPTLPQQAPPENHDPYDSEYWQPAQGASPGYAGGGIALPQPGMNVPPYPQPQYNTVIPDPNGDIITPYTDPNAEATPYVPSNAPPPPVVSRQPNAPQPQPADQPYDWRTGEPLRARSATPPAPEPSPWQQPTPPHDILQPRMRPAADEPAPYPTIMSDKTGAFRQPTPPHSLTPTPGGPGGGTYTGQAPPGGPGGGTYTGQAPDRGGPGGGTRTGQAASTRPTPPHSKTPDNMKTGSTHGVPTPTPRPGGHDGKPEHKDAKAAPKHDKKYYNDPYEREKERFATRDRAGNLLPTKKYAEGGVIPDRNDPYQNEQSNFAAPQPQAPAPQQVDPQQTGSLPPGSGQPLGQSSGRKPTPRLLSDVSKSLHNGIQFLTQHFGLAGDGAVPTPEGQQGAADGARRFASGEGATTPEEMNAVDDKVDPQRKMPEGDRNMMRLANVMQFYLERGRKEEAGAAAAGLMQAGAQRTQQYGSIAAAGYRKYLQSHDPADLQKVTQTLQAAYSMIPNGGDYGVTLDPQTHELNVSHTDDQGRVTNTPVSPDQLPDIIKSVQDKSAYWNQIQLLADPEGVHERDRAARSKDEDIRKHGVEQADTIASEGRAEGREIAGEGRKTEAQIATEKRAAETETAKDKRELDQKEAERKQGITDKIEEEKRAALTHQQEKLLDAGIHRAEEVAKNAGLDSSTLGKLTGDVFMAKNAPDVDSEAGQARLNEAYSRLQDGLPTSDVKTRADLFTRLSGIPMTDFEYTSKVAQSAVSDQPPTNYEGKQPGDVVKKGSDPDGNPVWYVNRDGKNKVIQGGG